MSGLDTWRSDGKEIAIRNPDGSKYVSVFLSKNRKRFGIRLEQCRKHVAWISPEIMPDLRDAIAALEERLK